MKSKRPVIVAIILLVAAAAAFFVLKRQNGSNGSGITIYGNVDIREVQLAFDAQGRITSMPAQEGEHVKKGQLLAEIDRERYEAVVRQLEAELDAQKAVVEKLHTGSRPQEIEHARAEMRAIEAELQDAIKSLRRLEALQKKQFVSRQSLDNARARVEATRQRMKAASETLKLLEIGPRREDIAAAEAKLNSLEARLALARKNLADTWLYAPDEGTIRDRILEPGDMAFPSRPVYTLALDNPVWVRAYLPEPMLGRVKPGATAWITTDSYPGKRYKGWVGYISPTAEFTPRNVETPELRTRLVYQVRIYVCNPENELRLGMPATVTIEDTDGSASGSGPGSLGPEACR
jgi:HlyD family secretion protein